MSSTLGSSQPYELGSQAAGVDLHTQAKQLEAMNLIAAALSSSLELDEVLHRAVSSLLDVTGLSSGVVYFLDEEQGLLVGRNAIGFRYGLTRGIDLHSTDSGSFPSRAFRSEDPLVFDVRDEARGYASITEAERNAIMPEHIETAVASRLESSSRVYGVLTLCSHHVYRPFTDEDLAFTQLVSGQIGVAIERARLYEDLKNRALEATTLYEMGRMLSARLESEAVLPSVLDLACLSFGFAGCKITLTEDIAGRSQLSSTEGANGTLGHEPLCLSLDAGSVKVGHLEVYHEGRITEQTRRRVKTMADLIAMTIWNRRLYGHSKRLGVMEERNRMAREIHDGLTQKFYGIQLQLEAAQRAAEPGSTALSSHLGLAMSYAGEGLEEARRSVRDLRCTGGPQGSFSDTVRRVVRQARDDSGIECGVVVRGRCRELAVEVETALLRSLQELVHNVEKHASASRVLVTVSFASARATVVVEDDGRGFLATKTLATPPQVRGGYGLLGIRERMTAVGGHLEITSTPGNGTTAKIIVPIAI